MAIIPAGISIHHVKSSRIEAHFERLKRETAGVIDWYRAYNPGNWVAVQNDFGVDAELFMPMRFKRMQQNGGVQNGFLDTVILPCASTLDREFVWVMEYDVDFTGHWGELFDSFADSRADLMTTLIRSKSMNPQWYHWRSAQAPDAITDDRQWRVFHPLMRLSNKFIVQYPRITADEAWRGHYEFVLPTAALNNGFLMEEFGGNGQFTPADRRGRFYNSETFKWRPSRDAYFIERPDAFQSANFLYHPVKPGIVDWNAKHKT